MGSSSSHLQWIVVAAFCGILYLIFDTVRYFSQQLGPVRLRRLSGDGSQGSRRRHWRQYDTDNFHLISGAMLQITLIIAATCTVMVFDQSIGMSVLFSALLWGTIVLAWKFVLAFVPDDMGEIILRNLVPFANFFYYAFWPILFPLRQMVERLDREAEEAEADEDPTDEEVRAYIDVGEEEGIIEASEGRLLQSIVDFGDRVAREIMTPRIDVLAFDARKPIADLAQLFSESKYSRIPIYQESIDAITGIVHIKEIFDAILRNEQRSVAELARPPYFVSETKSVSELLREFQSEHIQIAVVVDEYGGTAGVVTVEDIIEEIVGDISDEHEDEEANVVDLGDGSHLVSGLLRIERLDELLDADLSGDDYETVAGLIFTTLGRVPKVGATVTKNGFLFEVERADRRRIYRVKVSRDPNWQAEGEREND